MNNKQKLFHDLDDYQDLFPSFGISLSVHLFIFCLFFAISSILKKQFKTENADILELRKKLEQSVRVDIVALPKFTVQELKKMPVIPAAQPESVDPGKQTVKESEELEIPGGESEQVNDLLGNLAKKDVLAKEKKDLQPSAKNQISQKDRKNISKLVLEGNILNKEGTTALGKEADGQVLSDFEQYVLSIPEQIRPFWKLPSYLLEKDLQCRIQIFVNSEGKIINIKLVQTSGVDEFDQRALSSVKEAQFVMKPEKKFITTLLTKGVVLGFPL